MIVRVRSWGVALAAVLTIAPACLAAPPDYVPGKGGIGGQFGVSTFKLDRIMGSSWFGDYSLGAKSLPRFAVSAQFRYVATPWLRIELSPGFTWAGYQGSQPRTFLDRRFPNELTKGQYLTLMLPVSLEAQYVMRRGSWLYYAGAGPGVYRVWVEDHREVLKDPVTFKLHRGVYPGGSAGFGFERFFKELNSTSLEFSITGHLALAGRDQQFPSGFNSNVMALQVKIGGNYYFHTAQSRKPEQATPPAPN